MARKAYVADVLAAAANPPPHISNVVRGGEDGELDFCYTPSTSQPINIHTLASGNIATSFFCASFDDTSKLSTSIGALEDQRDIDIAFCNITLCNIALCNI
jgi:hypothetical protein